MICFVTKAFALSIMLSLISTGPCLVSGGRVHLVNVLYRHGDRSPTQTYPNSEYQEDFWPQGFGELSRRGIQMQFALGKYLRARYSDLLNSTFSRYEIYVRSTDVNRTLMSAQADLAGLYPPSGDQIWNQGILWQPIPVHTVPVPDDYLLRTSGSPCPMYDKLHNETLKHDPEYLKLNEENADFLGYVSQKAGYETNLTINEVWTLQDPLKVERINNLTLPEWATNETLAKLNHLGDLGMYFLFNTKEKSRLRAGKLVGEMIGNMMNSQSTTVPDNKRQKMWMYSAHDTTLTAFMSALGVFNKEVPPLASCVGLDFIQEEEGNNHKYSVHMWFHNDTQGEPYSLTLPGCADPCPIQDFIELTRDIVPEDIKKDCGVEPHSSSLSLIILIVIVAVILTAVIVALLCIVICRRRTGEPRHTRLPTEDANA